MNCEVNQRQPISSTKCMDLLIVGYPHKLIQAEIQKYQISLVEEPIHCNNDWVSWLRLSASDASNLYKYSHFNKALMIRHS